MWVKVILLCLLCIGGILEWSIVVVTVNDSNDLFHTFLTLTCLSADYRLMYHNMSIYRNTLRAIHQYGKTQYHCSSSRYLNSSSYCNPIATKVWLNQNWHRQRVNKHEMRPECEATDGNKGSPTTSLTCLGRTAVLETKYMYWQLRSKYSSNNL